MTTPRPPARGKPPAHGAHAHAAPVRHDDGGQLRGKDLARMHLRSQRIAAFQKAAQQVQQPLVRFFRIVQKVAPAHAAYASAS